MKKTVILLAVSLGLAGCTLYPKTSTSQVTPAATDTALPSNEIQYNNKSLGLSFSYPTDWKVDDTTNSSDFVLLRLQSPESLKNNELSKETGIGEGPYNYDLEVYSYPDFSAFTQKYGIQQENKKYVGLTDYLNDPINEITKTGEISINNGKNTAQEVSIGGYGLSYALVIEHNGIIVLSFTNSEDKSRLSNSQKNIINSIKLY